MAASVSQWRWIRSVCLQAGNRRGFIFLREGPAFGQGAHSTVTGPPGPRVGCLQLSNLAGESCPLPSPPPPLGCTTTGRRRGAVSFASPFCSLTVSFLPSEPPPHSPPLPPRVPDLLKFWALPTPSQAQFRICSHGNSVLRMRKLYPILYSGARTFCPPAQGPQVAHRGSSRLQPSGKDPGRRGVVVRATGNGPETPLASSGTLNPAVLSGTRVPQQQAPGAQDHMGARPRARRVPPPHRFTLTTRPTRSL